MKIAVFGLGYVGAINAVSLALAGHEIWAVDKDPTKVRWMADGIPPINEPQFADALKAALASGRLHVGLEAGPVVANTEIALICVGTPTPATGGTYLGFVEAVANDIHAALTKHPHPYTVAMRSTIPPGTMEALLVPALLPGVGRHLGADLQVCFNPEFLREGTAIDDFANPPFTIVGTQDADQGSDTVMSQMKEVYRGAQGPIIRMSFREAELLKLVCNVFHALKISFANEIGAVAGQLGADAERLMKTFVLDTKLNISAAYLRPGFAFGGSCLPKDLRSLMHVGKDLGLALPVTEAILPSNDAHLNRIAAAVLRRPGNTVGIAGLVFKAGTDDVRESPAVKLAGHLVAAGRSILVHEPEIQVEKLVGANLAFLREHLPEYAKQLVSWSTLNNQSDLIVFTRPGLVSPPARKQVSKPCIDIYHIGSY